MKKLILICLALLLTIPAWAHAKIGVGVGTGKITVDQSLQGGLIYTLPSFNVLNTGDEPSDYGVGIQYRDSQPELRPDKEWFTFTPNQFHLDPGQVQVVEVKLSLPIKGAIPGDYFAFLQGFPVKTATSTGGTSVGVAAAAKLYFTIVPANIFAGIYYRTISLFKVYSPTSYIVLGIVALIILIALFKKYFSFNIGINLKKKES